MGDLSIAEAAKARRYRQPLLRLDGRAVSPEAAALVSHVLNSIVLSSLPPQRPTSAERLRLAVGATLAGLIAAPADDWQGGWLRRPMSNQSLAGEPVGRTLFPKVVADLEAAGLIAIAKGFLDRSAGPAGKARETRLRLTEAGRKLAEGYGVTQGNVRSHFDGVLTEDPSGKTGEG